MKTWQKEYILFCCPDIEGTDDPMIEHLFKTTNFDSNQARIFKSGWDKCLHVIGTNIEFEIIKLEQEK